MKKILSLIIAALLFLTAGGCNKGIEPEPENGLSGQTGFSGKVTFVGNWPAGVTRTHLFVFKSAIKSSGDFSFLNLSAVIDPIPYGSTEFVYNSVEQNYIEHEFIPEFKIVPGDHAYVVVAQSTNPEISFARGDWTVVGIYNINGDQSKPKTLMIQIGKITTGVDITVDFNNPPAQPPM